MGNLVVRRDSVQTGQGIVLEDYDVHPQLCRRGQWMGRRTYFTQTVVVEYEHDTDIRVSWLLRGEQYVTAGTGAEPGGVVLGVEGITYLWPYGDATHPVAAHAIALVSKPGAPLTRISVQALYTMPIPRNGPIDTTVYDGGTTIVQISGASTAWPAFKLAEEARCRDRLSDALRDYVRYRVPKLGEPVVDDLDWLDDLSGTQAARLEATIEHLRSMDAETEPDLVADLQADLVEQIRLGRPWRGAVDQEAA